ncbi:MAG: hypothetical protein ACTHJM_03255 [Marmoricola sp.]
MKTVGVKVLCTAIGSAVVSALLVTSPGVASATPRATPHVHPAHPTKQVLKQPMHGRAAVQALGGNLAYAAAVNGRTPANLRQLLTSDPTMWLTTKGQLFVKEELPNAADRAAAVSAGNATATPASSLSQTQTFSLHSNPGSQHTIYLDFIGATVASGTFWTSGDAGTPVAAGRYAPWSIDSNPAFSSTELADIYEVWRRVSEHYAAFDVDVTTQAPSEAALVRSSISDQTYGIRVLFANTVLDSSSAYASTAAAWNAICSQHCAGVATIGTIAEVGRSATDEYFQPAWVFTDGLGGFQGAAFPKWMADDAAHEVGHTFGLTHQGTTTDTRCTGQPVGCSYFDGYSGAGSPQYWLWGPLMGDPYAAAVSQWAHGEYPNANNPQNELATIAQSAALKTAAAGTTLSSAVALPATGATGVITSSADHEYYSLGTCTGSVSVTGRPATLGPDLNVQLTLLDSNGAVVSQAAPHAALSLDPSSTDVEPLASGMSHTVGTPAASAQGYYLEVSGGGSYADGANGAADAASGFSSYGSIGAYSLSGASGCTPPVTAPSAPTALQLNTSCGGEALTWKPPTDSGNAALTRYEVSVDNSGTWTSMGTAGSAYFRGITGGHTYAVRAVNKAGAGQASSIGVPGAASGITVTYQGTTTDNNQTLDEYQLTWTAPSAAGGLAIGGYALSLEGASGTVPGPSAWATVTPGTHPTLTITPTNAAGLGTPSYVALQDGATGTTGAPPVPTSYTGTPISYCPAVPSAPRSVRLARGASGGALTTTGTWLKPSTGQPATFTYSVRVDTRNRAGRITATHYYSTSHTSLAIKGSSGYTYRIRVRAHNATGWGSWSAFTGWVAPR